MDEDGCVWMPVSCRVVQVQVHHVGTQTSDYPKGKFGRSPVAAASCPGWHPRGIDYFSAAIPRLMVADHHLAESATTVVQE
jgi:hypothetical protein